MVTSIYIDYLTAYHIRLKNWAENNRTCIAKGRKAVRMNEAQRSDHFKTLECRTQVIGEICRVERELENLKISTNSIFKL